MSGTLSSGIHITFRPFMDEDRPAVRSQAANTPAAFPPQRTCLRVRGTGGVSGRGSSLCRNGYRNIFRRHTKRETMSVIWCAVSNVTPCRSNSVMLPAILKRWVAVDAAMNRQ